MGECDLIISYRLEMVVAYWLLCSYRSLTKVGIRRRLLMLGDGLSESLASHGYLCAPGTMGHGTLLNEPNLTEY